MTTPKNAARAPALTLLVSFGPTANAVEPESSTAQVLDRSVKFDGLKISHREGGPKDAPKILLKEGGAEIATLIRDFK